MGNTYTSDEPIDTLFSSDLNCHERGIALPSIYLDKRKHPYRQELYLQYDDHISSGTELSRIILGYPPIPLMSDESIENAKNLLSQFASNRGINGVIEINRQPNHICISFQRE